MYEYFPGRGRPYRMCEYFPGHGRPCRKCELESTLKPVQISIALQVPGRRTGGTNPEKGA